MEKETKKKKTTKNVKKESKTKEKVVEKEIEVEVVKEEKSFFEKNKDIIAIALIAILTAVTLISTNIKKNESTEKINFINYGTITEVSNFKDTLISDYQTYETFINYYEVESKLTKVDFPPPELPTMAIVSFLLTFKLKFFKTGCSGMYSK